jgi:hypothetical protein
MSQQRPKTLCDIFEIFEKRYLKLELNHDISSSPPFARLRGTLQAAWYEFFIKRSSAAEHLLQNTYLHFSEGTVNEIAWDAAEWVAEAHTSLALYRWLETTEGGGQEASCEEVDVLMLDHNKVNHLRANFLECICQMMGVEYRIVPYDL